MSSTARLPAVSVTAPDGVIVETVGRDDQRIGPQPSRRTACPPTPGRTSAEATVITVPAEFAGRERNLVVLITGQGTARVRPAHRDCGRSFSKAVVVLDHQGSAVVSENVEIIVEDGAELTVVSLQEWNDDAVHASSQQAKIGRDAKFKHIVVSLGGDLVRVTPSTRFTAPGRRRRNVRPVLRRRRTAP